MSRTESGVQATGMKGTDYFYVGRSSARVLKRFVRRIPRGRQGGYVYHVINRGNGRLTAVQYVRWQYEADTISLLFTSES